MSDLVVWFAGVSLLQRRVIGKRKMPWDGNDAWSLNDILTVFRNVKWIPEASHWESCLVASTQLGLTLEKMICNIRSSGYLIQKSTLSAYFNILLCAMHGLSNVVSEDGTPYASSFRRLNALTFQLALLILQSQMNQSFLTQEPFPFHISHSDLICATTQNWEQNIHFIKAKKGKASEHRVFWESFFDGLVTIFMCLLLKQETGHEICWKDIFDDFSTSVRSSKFLMETCVAVFLMETDIGSLFYQDETALFNQNQKLEQKLTKNEFLMEYLNYENRQQILTVFFIYCMRLKNIPVENLMRGVKIINGIRDCSQLQNLTEINTNLTAIGEKFAGEGSETTILLFNYYLLANDRIEKYMKILLSLFDQSPCELFADGDSLIKKYFATDSPSLVRVSLALLLFLMQIVANSHQNSALLRWNLEILMLPCDEKLMSLFIKIYHFIHDSCEQSPRDGKLTLRELLHQSPLLIPSKIIFLMAQSHAQQTANFLYDIWLPSAIVRVKFASPRIDPVSREHSQIIDFVSLVNFSIIKLSAIFGWQKLKTLVAQFAGQFADDDQAPFSYLAFIFDVFHGFAGIFANDRSIRHDSSIKLWNNLFGDACEISPLSSPSVGLCYREDPVLDALQDTPTNLSTPHLFSSPSHSAPSHFSPSPPLSSPISPPLSSPSSPIKTAHPRGFIDSTRCASRVTPAHFGPREGPRVESPVRKGKVETASTSLGRHAANFWAVDIVRVSKFDANDLETLIRSSRNPQLDHPVRISSLESIKNCVGLLSAAVSEYCRDRSREQSHILQLTVSLNCEASLSSLAFDDHSCSENLMTIYRVLKLASRSLAEHLCFLSGKKKYEAREDEERREGGEEREERSYISISTRFDYIEISARILMTILLSLGPLTTFAAVARRIIACEFDGLIENWRSIAKRGFVANLSEFDTTSFYLSAKEWTHFTASPYSAGLFLSASLPRLAFFQMHQVFIFSAPITPLFYSGASKFDEILDVSHQSAQCHQIIAGVSNFDTFTGSTSNFTARKTDNLMISPYEHSQYPLSPLFSPYKASQSANVFANKIIQVAPVWAKNLFLWTVSVEDPFSTDSRPPANARNWCEQEEKSDQFLMRLFHTYPVSLRTFFLHCRNLSSSNFDGFLTSLLSNCCLSSPSPLSPYAGKENLMHFVLHQFLSLSPPSLGDYSQCERENLMVFKDIKNKISKVRRVDMIANESQLRIVRSANSPREETANEHFTPSLLTRSHIFTPTKSHHIKFFDPFNWIGRSLREDFLMIKFSDDSKLGKTVLRRLIKIKGFQLNNQQKINHQILLTACDVEFLKILRDLEMAISSFLLTSKLDGNGVISCATRAFARDYAREIFDVFFTVVTSIFYDFMTSPVCENFVEFDQLTLRTFTVLFALNSVWSKVRTVAEFFDDVYKEMKIFDAELELASLIVRNNICPVSFLLNTSNFFSSKIYVASLQKHFHQFLMGKNSPRLSKNETRIVLNQIFMCELFSATLKESIALSVASVRIIAETASILFDAGSLVVRAAFESSKLKIKNRKFYDSLDLSSPSLFSSLLPLCLLSPLHEKETERVGRWKLFFEAIDNFSQLIFTVSNRSHSSQTLSSIEETPTERDTVIKKSPLTSTSRSQSSQSSHASVRTSSSQLLSVAIGLFFDAVEYRQFLIRHILPKIHFHQKLLQVSAEETWRRQMEVLENNSRLWITFLFDNLMLTIGEIGEKSPSLFRFFDHASNQPTGSLEEDKTGEERRRDERRGEERRGEERRGEIERRELNGTIRTNPSGISPPPGETGVTPYTLLLFPPQSADGYNLTPVESSKKKKQMLRTLLNSSVRSNLFDVENKNTSIISPPSHISPISPHIPSSSSPTCSRYSPAPVVDAASLNEILTVLFILLRIMERVFPDVSRRDRSQSQIVDRSRALVNHSLVREHSPKKASIYQKNSSHYSLQASLKSRSFAFGANSPIRKVRSDPVSNKCEQSAIDNERGAKDNKMEDANTRDLISHQKCEIWTPERQETVFDACEKLFFSGEKKFIKFLSVVMEFAMILENEFFDEKKNYLMLRTISVISSINDVASQILNFAVSKYNSRLLYSDRQFLMILLYTSCCLTEQNFDETREREMSKTAQFLVRTANNLQALYNLMHSANDASKTLELLLPILFSLRKSLYRYEETAKKWRGTFGELANNRTCLDSFAYFASTILFIHQELIQCELFTERKLDISFNLHQILMSLLSFHVSFVENRNTLGEREERRGEERRGEEEEKFVEECHSFMASLLYEILNLHQKVIVRLNVNTLDSLRTNLESFEEKKKESLDYFGMHQKNQIWSEILMCEPQQVHLILHASKLIQSSSAPK